MESREVVRGGVYTPTAGMRRSKNTCEAMLLGVIVAGVVAWDGGFGAWM